jgi:uncharacterized protein YutE (UPF0331/DUF86 family)
MNSAEKMLLREVVADYTETVVCLSVEGATTEELLKEMTGFYNLLVGALTASKRDGMICATSTTLN